MVRDAGYEPEPRAKPAKKAQEPARAREATLASPSLEKAPQSPMEGIAGQLVGLLTSLFDAVATHHAASSELAYRRISEQVTQDAVHVLDQRIQQLMPLCIQAALEKHLGEGIDVPRVELPPLDLDLKGSGLGTRLKVDVVGLFPRQITDVKRALNGYADSIRFIEAGEVSGSWVPRDIVLTNTKVSGHIVETKCRKHNVHLLRVWGTSTAVVNAITELYAQQGVDLKSAH